MKILLVAPKDWIVPIGLSYISSALKEAGHSVDCRYYEDAEALRAHLGAGYDFLATGGMSIHFNQLAEIISIARACRTRVILGGNIVTSEAEFITKTLGVDFGVIGQGEETVVELLRCLERNGDPAGVAGIGFLKDGQLVLTERRKPARDLDSLPWPDYEAFGFRQKLDAARPSDNTPFWDVFDYPREYLLVAARSCPYSCTFCYHPPHEPYRQRSIESLMREVETVVPKYRINILSITDDLFSEKEERVHALCKELRKFREGLPWDLRWSCQMRVSGTTAGMLEDMKKSGCFLISYGFESYHPDVLKSMKKRITPEQIHRTIHATLDRNLSIAGNFIFGDKAETMETARETLRFWQAHPEAGLNLEFVQPYPDSELYRYCIEEQIIRDKLEYMREKLFSIVNMTNMTDEEFNQLHELVWRLKLETPAVMPLRGTANSLTVRCPYCQAVSTYRNYASPRLANKVLYCRGCRKRMVVRNRLRKMLDGPFLLSLRFALAKAKVPVTRWRRRLHLR